MMEGDKWALPGGHIDIGETAIEAVKRETKEETGLGTEGVKFFNYYDEFFPQIKIHAIVLIFTANSEGELKTNGEVTETAWITKNDISKYEFAFKHEKIITEYFKERK